VQDTSTDGRILPYLETEADMNNRSAVRTVLLLAMLLGANAFAHPESATPSTVDSPAMAARVKTEFLHAWSNYKRYAWGHDELRPLSRTPHDWYGQSLLMTPVDALDTLVLMGLTKEADADRELIATKLDFDKDIYVKNFEITIRMLGGLLSGYQLTGDARLLHKAEDLGTRLLPVFDSPTGLPYVYVNLHTGKTRGVKSNPAETGTLLLEFGTLSKLSGNPVFYDKAKRALVETFKRSSKIGLVGVGLDVETGAWIDPDASISGGIDSYYEYLWKCWRLFGDTDCKAMWDASIPAVHRYLADDVDGQLWYGHADMNTGKRTTTEYGALDAYFPAVLALSGDADRAARLQDSSFRMWNLHGIEPEVLDYRTLKVEYASYELRPEIVESTYYLFHFTHDPKYLAMGRTLFDDFVKYDRAAHGYAALKSVVTKQQRDAMESFALAETFKYYYLLFDPGALDFDAVTFNTEAHPLRRTWPHRRSRCEMSSSCQPALGDERGLHFLFPSPGGRRRIAPGILPPATFAHPCAAVAPGIVPPATFALCLLRVPLRSQSRACAIHGFGVRRTAPNPCAAKTGRPLARSPRPFRTSITALRSSHGSNQTQQRSNHQHRRRLAPVANTRSPDSTHLHDIHRRRHETVELRVRGERGDHRQPRRRRCRRGDPPLVATGPDNPATTRNRGTAGLALHQPHLRRCGQWTDRRPRLLQREPRAHQHRAIARAGVLDVMRKLAQQHHQRQPRLLPQAARETAVLSRRDRRKIRIARGDHVGQGRHRRQKRRVAGHARNHARRINDELRIGGLGHEVDRDLRSAPRTSWRGSRSLQRCIHRAGGMTAGNAGPIAGNAGPTDVGLHKTNSNLGEGLG